MMMRREHVLIERSGPGGSSSTAAGAGPWGLALLEALEHHHYVTSSSMLASSASSTPKRRSPSFRSTRPGTSSRLRPSSSRSTPDRIRDDLPLPTQSSPRPLSIHSLQSSFNPFVHFNIRSHLMPEVTLLLSALLFALYRIHSITSTSAILAPNILLPVPLLSSLLVVALSIPFLALFRRSDASFQVPFTDARGYRDLSAADDGVTAAISVPLLLALACVWDVYGGVDRKQLDQGVGLEGIRTLVEIWNSSPALQSSSTMSAPFRPDQTATAQALFSARYQLLLFIFINSIILLLHLLLSRTILKIDRLPKSNTKRFLGFACLASSVSSLVWIVLLTFEMTSIGDGLPISPFEGAVSSFIQQTSFYCISRLARRGFTLGELSTMTAAGNALCLEFWRMSQARWSYTRGIPLIASTFRSPTPILVFQTVLIPGAFLAGFLLSPLLVLSRHIAQKPSHRLKWPTERELHRKLLAAGIFFCLFGIVFFLLGGWAGWMLGGGLTRPWTWAIEFIIYGDDGLHSDSILTAAGSHRAKGWTRWRRPVLIAYWAATIVIAVGGWQTRLVRARRVFLKSNGGSGPKHSIDSTISKMTGISNHNGSKGSVVLSGVSEAGGSVGPKLIKIGVEGAREEKRVHASLNMRRKFFHALAVMMFVPGIVADPAFTSLAFSVAFALFTFSEYARFFALYPIGAQLHIFFTEFVDSKDSGPVILSHFYLLSGCASGLWLEGSGIKRLTGVLVLGVGDALASIVGKMIGRVRWPGTTKTVEGSVAFVVSIVLCAWGLRITGSVDDFSMWRYALATILAALLEATSSQNDNLIIPIYMWSVLSLFSV